MAADSWENFQDMPRRIRHDLAELGKDFWKDPAGTTNEVINSVPPSPQVAAVGVGRLGTRTAISLGGMAKSEYQRLSRLWGQGSFKNIAESLRYHYTKHGRSSFATYLRKADSFNYRGAQKISRSDGTTIHRRSSGEFVIKDRDGKIVSYGEGRRVHIDSRIAG
jgi:hypothetical protein